MYNTIVVYLFYFVFFLTFVMLDFPTLRPSHLYNANLNFPLYDAMSVIKVSSIQTAFVSMTYSLKLVWFLKEKLPGQITLGFYVYLLSEILITYSHFFFFFLSSKSDAYFFFFLMDRNPKSISLTA